MAIFTPVEPPDPEKHIMSETPLVNTSASRPDPRQAFYIIHSLPGCPERFSCRNPETGEPLGGEQVRVISTGGYDAIETTDAEGYTRWVSHDTAEVFMLFPLGADGGIPCDHGVPTQYLGEAAVAASATLWLLSKGTRPLPASVKAYLLSRER